jgi:hypothetical protein
MAFEPISTAYFINSFHQSLCLYVYTLFVAKQRLGKNVTTAMNTEETTEELLGVSFTMFHVVSRKVGD